MTQFDAVICGAGPSGSTAAKYMSDRGLKVAVLEKKRFPRDKPCGGALRSTIVDEFDHIREGVSKIPHCISRRAKMYPSSLRHPVDYRPGKAVLYNIRRRHFDTMLAEKARDAGAELREEAQVSKVSISHDHGVVHLKGGEEISCNVIIGAGGMHDPVARYLRRKEGLPENWPKSDIGLVIVEEHEVGEDFISEKFGEERTCHFHLKPNNLYGYAWVFPKRSALNLGFGAFWRDIRNLDIRSTFKSYIELLKKEGLVPKDLEMGKPKGAPVPLRGAIKKTVSERILLIGDAAGFVSPIGGDGLYYAIDSGRIAADVVDRAVEQDRFGIGGLGSYQRTWYNAWGRDLEVLCYFADKINKSAERVMRYASRDKLFRDMCIRLYDGQQKATELKWRILRRVARNYLLYDVLRKK